MVQVWLLTKAMAMLLLLPRLSAHRSIVVISMLVLAAPTLAAAPVVAFVSVPPKTSPHDEITKEAAERAGFPAGGLLALQEAVRRPDLQEMSWDPSQTTIDSINVENDYAPSHHCDRDVDEDSGDAFDRAVAYIAEQRRLAEEHAASEDDDDDAAVAVGALGRALHTAQDCFAHANVASLGPEAVAQYKEAVMGEASAPEGLRLTVIDPSAERPGAPDHPYAHDEYAADSPDANAYSNGPAPGYEGLTNYEVSHAAAVDVSTRIIQSFLAQSSEDDLEAYGDLSARETHGWWGVLNVWTASVAGAVVLLLVGGVGYGLRRWLAHRD